MLVMPWAIPSGLQPVLKKIVYAFASHLGTCGGQERVSDPPKLECSLQIVVLGLCSDCSALLIHLSSYTVSVGWFCCCCCCLVVFCFVLVRKEEI